MQQSQSFKFKLAIGFVLALGVILFSQTAQKYSLIATNKVICSVALNDLCGRIANQLSEYSAPDAAQIHRDNCFNNKDPQSCLNASIIYNRLKNTPMVVQSLAQACLLGDSSSCTTSNRAAQRWISESEASRVTAKEMRKRLEFVLSIYTRACENGEGESCALVAKSPLSSAKDVYKFFYRGCYDLKHPTACIGLAEYFKTRGQTQLAQNAVAKICSKQRSLACLELQQRMSDPKTAQMRTPSSGKKIN